MLLNNGPYINTRVIRGAYADEYLVQGQSSKTYNWSTLVRYPATQKAIAEIDACNKARKFSETVVGLVTAYDTNGYEIKSYLEGKLYETYE